MLQKINQKVLYIALVVLAVFIIFLVYSLFFSSLEVELYFADEQAQYLLPEVRTIDRANLYQDSIKELILGPTDEELLVTIPEETQLLGIEVSDGLATVDFSEDIVLFHWGGSTGERMTVYSIVNTLTQFDDIEQVQILVAGEQKETLVGHLDISGPIEFEETIIK